MLNEQEKRIKDAYILYKRAQIFTTPEYLQNLANWKKRLLPTLDETADQLNGRRITPNGRKINLTPSRAKANLEELHASEFLPAAHQTEQSADQIRFLYDDLLGKILKIPDHYPLSFLKHLADKPASPGFFVYGFDFFIPTDNLLSPSRLITVALASPKLYVQENEPPKSLIVKNQIVGNINPSRIKIMPGSIPQLFLEPETTVQLQRLTLGHARRREFGYLQWRPEVLLTPSVIQPDWEAMKSINWSSDPNLTSTSAATLRDQGSPRRAFWFFGSRVKLPKDIENIIHT